MLAVQVAIVQWVDDAQPGVVACELVDAYGNAHRFVDKLPIFTSAGLDQHSSYPQPGWIACTLVEQQRDLDGRAVMIVDTEAFWHIASTSNTARFAVLREQLSEI